MGASGQVAEKHFTSLVMKIVSLSFMSISQSIKRLGQSAITLVITADTRNEEVCGGPSASYESR